MSAQDVVAHLLESGYRAVLSSDEQTLTVEIDVGERQLTLRHTIPSKMLRPPSFDLVDSESFGTLAHVLPDLETGFAKICVEHLDSVSVNYDVPSLAYAESIKRHRDLLTPLIEDSEWNRSELIREFHSNWELLCARAGTLLPALFFAGSDNCPDGLQVKLPDRDAKVGIRGNFFALPQQQATNKAFETARRSARWSQRQTAGKAIVLKLTATEPAPADPAELFAWYFQVLDSIDPSSRDAFSRFQRHPSKVFWLVFSTILPNGPTWFAIRFSSPQKSKLPVTVDQVSTWHITPHSVRSLTRESLVPRGGASLDLSEKSVLLVGCGSVGSEVAHRITSSGIGKLTIMDSESFSEDNLYRHTLSIADIGYGKSGGVASDLRLRYPWAEIEPLTTRLESIGSVEVLDQFDLIIIAIGSPTVERSFHDYYQASGTTVAAINTWVEAHGIGGHATLDIPASTGCLKCAYVDPEELIRSLSSNLNFLAPNQNVTQTHGGCGNQFLPYSSVAASYTATMTADLAVQYLLGDRSDSSKVSWKGDSTEAEKHGFAVTHRYHHFSNSLEIQLLLNRECDVCNE